jgi:hypothetical protein
MTSQEVSAAPMGGFFATLAVLLLRVFVSKGKIVCSACPVGKAL